MAQAWAKAGLLLVGAYSALVGAAYAAQRKLLFPAPQPPREPSPQHGELVKTTTAAGAEVFALWSKAAPDAPAVVHFHGNGEQMADAGGLAQVFRSEGISMLAVEYPGYGLASGQEPSEEALYATAEAALRYLQEQLQVPRERTLLMGQSLGTGVATEMALRGYGVRLALLSPYTSIPEVAARVVPILPSRRLIRDRFASEEKAAKISVPVLILHGEQDELIPVSMGRRLGTLFPQAKVEVFAGAHHNDLFAPPHGRALLARLVSFLRAPEP